MGVEMQRIFDIENEKDYADLWDILPDDIRTVEKWNDCYLSGKEPTLFYCDIIKINWHDKTEITRPKNYESMIGCVGWFNDIGDVNKKTDRLSLLVSYKKDDEVKFIDVFGGTWRYFIPAKKSELKFYGE